MKANIAMGKIEKQLSCAAVIAVVLITVMHDEAMSSPVRTEAKAISIATRDCAWITSTHKALISWKATFLKGPPKDTWRVDGTYDASGNGTLALVNLIDFVPADGSQHPDQCMGVVN